MVVSETLYEQLRDAVFDNDKARLQELLQQDGVDVDHFDAGGQTLLHLACFWGRMELVKVLLNARASLKTKNAAGCTALDLATHWGHSAVAEVIRLRGGRSVWEEKLGHLQVTVEDLKLQALQSQKQSVDKKREFETLQEDFHALHSKYEEAKSSRTLSLHAVAKARHEAQSLSAEVTRLEAALAEMTANYHSALIEKAKTEHLHQESQREMLAVIAHRDEVLHTMQESVHKQEAAAENWQRAEVAAAMAESQRNFAFAERDRFQKKHVAALGELVIITARLDAAEDELMGLKTDLAEHIYEKKREQKVKKRAERAVSHVSAREGSISSSSQSSSSANRTVAIPIAGEPQHPSGTSASAKQKKKLFSLAAREFGERLRAEEVKKRKDRVKRHEKTENQYRTQGFANASIRNSDRFQEEFVTNVQSFAAAQSAKWKDLKKDRDRQAWFTRSVLARPIATAPQPVRFQGDHDGGLGDSPSHLDDGEEDPLAPLRSPAAKRMSKSSHASGRVHYGIYQKYARPACLDNPLRPETSPMEIRMQTSFFSEKSIRDKGDTEGVKNADLHPKADTAGGLEPEDTLSSPTFLPSVR